MMLVLSKRFVLMLESNGFPVSNIRREISEERNVAMTNPWVVSE